MIVLITTQRGQRENRELKRGTEKLLGKSGVRHREWGGRRPQALEPSKAV